MQTKTSLKIDWATHEAAKYACENWHYSKSIPVGQLLKVGAWENEKFIGVVLFGHGANFRIGEPYRLSQYECVELVRVALRNHSNPVSKIMAIALRFLAKTNKKLRLVISYADSEQGHHGGIYQATNWLYSGFSQGSEKVWYKGKWVHKRTVDSRFGHHKGFKTKKTKGKHTYLMPLDDEMRRQIEPLKKPYPKRAGSIVVDVPEVHLGEGGAEPTSALQLTEADNGTA